MIRKLFVQKISSIASAAFIIALAGVFSRVLGVIRDRVLAGQFGAGSTLDMYYTAFRIPDLVFNFIVFGAISAGFIPIFSKLLKNEEDKDYSTNKQAWDFVSNVINVFSVLLLVVTVIILIFADKIVPLISPGFSDNQMAITSTLTKIMFLSPILLGISGIVGGVLQTYKRFFVYSLAPIMYNFGIIIGAIWLVDWFGINGLAWGVVLGALLHLLIQVPLLSKFGYKFHFIFKFKDSNLREISTLMIPRVLGLVTTQVNLIVITIFSSLIAVGSITVFNFANNLQGFPLALVGISFAIAAFPTLSRLYNENKILEFKKSFIQTARMIFFLILPLSAVFIVLRVQIVRVVLGSGVFNWQDTLLTADALGIFAVSLFAQSLIPLLARSFYSMHNTITPFIAGLSGAIINLILAFTLPSKYGFLGLIIAFTISSIVNFLVLFIAFRIKIGKLNDPKIIISFVKVVFASFIMGGAMYYLKIPIARYFDLQSFWGILMQSLVLFLIGLIVYLMVCQTLRCPELKMIIEATAHRLNKKIKVKSEGIDSVSMN
ncbi:murein biosynthesis integral membrane protein MurJ [Candidatus Falkowbacteria bacterium RIFOXYD2_FULL_35_9]|uniref:Probable lipid II flippase MurJ n=1 Tax=Candidatus Falkowbacteria bacterium RIFOXYC2_FULL_36_12 TaxID=1798002 RepID=A0A1F5SZ61_9BACT|nr:MAG: murein biosynthesis integral membrane protein MurJ [Candidatus Falkowbacteria bacterium RIFOXYB2_FULL_35_7]OGF31743.1 MAG: murein biosynthesis integral membrane protein MurJ [Candidatus Falkowbacteria bacterium RIFOXYC2_FULL_36_12]OGF48435.1 MAG: murein biosynthesis integral membrane protein MurJ [Candidatus Falkowbacteria bacterium RIFOXYD2_FULL_35_9]